MRLNMVWTVDKIRGKGRSAEQGYLFWEVAEREAGGDRSKVGVVTGAKVRAVECGHCTMYVPVRG